MVSFKYLQHFQISHANRWHVLLQHHLPLMRFPFRLKNVAMTCICYFSLMTQTKMLKAIASYIKHISFAYYWNMNSSKLEIFKRLKSFRRVFYSIKPVISMHGIEKTQINIFLKSSLFCKILKHMKCKNKTFNRNKKFWLYPEQLKNIFHSKFKFSGFLAFKCFFFS